MTAGYPNVAGLSPVHRFFIVKIILGYQIVDQLGGGGFST